MSATDAEPRSSASAALEEIDEGFGEIAAASAFSSMGLRYKTRAGYVSHRQVDDELSCTTNPSTMLINPGKSSAQGSAPKSARCAGRLD